MYTSSVIPGISRSPALLLAFAGLTFPQAWAATILPLGDLPGGLFYSMATRISDDGGTVVGDSDAGSYHASFRWTFDTGTVPLTGVPQSRAVGVSGDGTVAAGNNDQTVFRWTAGGGTTEPGDIPMFYVAQDLSADGTTIVGGANSPRAFRWTATEGTTVLGTLPGHTSSRANGVSADGSVAVGFSANGTTSEAFRWTASGGMVGLGHLPGLSQSYAAGVSRDGSVVVGDGSSAVSGSYEAFRWTEADGMQGLGDIPGGIGHTLATAVSDDGSVVVGTANNFLDAFVWTPDLNMVTLCSLLADLGVDTLEWSALSSVTDVSANGRYLAGVGTRFGNTEAFRVDLGENWQAQFQSAVPEPSTYAAGLVALGGLAARWRRARRA